MTLHRIISLEPLHISFVDEESGAKTDAAIMIVNGASNFLPMLLHRSNGQVGVWQSSHSCRLITAWRANRLLRRVQRVRTYGFDGGTIAGIVNSLNSDQTTERIKDVAADFDLTPEAYMQLVREMRNLWPSSDHVLSMWLNMTADEQDREQRFWAKAVADDNLEPSPRLTALIEQSTLRVATSKQLLDREDEQVQTDLTADTSLRQLMLDLGVRNLIFTLGIGDFGEPTHFNLEKLDSQILSNLIGTFGHYKQIELLSSTLQPNDPGAHLVEQLGTNMTMYSSNFGAETRPIVIMPNGPQYMIAVRWVRVTERFQIALRPLGSEDNDTSQDVWMTIADIRAGVGEVCHLDGPLPAGQIVQYPTNS